MLWCLIWENSRVGCSIAISAAMLGHPGSPEPSKTRVSQGRGQGTLCCGLATAEVRSAHCNPSELILAQRELQTAGAMAPYLATRISLEALFAASSPRTGPMFDFQPRFHLWWEDSYCLMCSARSRGDGRNPGLLGQTDVQLDQHLVGITSRVCTVLRICLKLLLWL